MIASVHPSLGRVLDERFAALAALTDKPGELNRLYLSPAFREACDQVAVWMKEAGMTAWVDAVGNVVGRYEGQRPDLPTLLLGSHIDTVRDAGKYDGTLGVLAAIACVQALHDNGTRLPFAIEVYVFGNEEGVRFPTILTGSLRCRHARSDDIGCQGCRWRDCARGAHCDRLRSRRMA